MHYYNYTLYTPSNSIFFNLNYNGTPTVVADDVYYKYTVLAGSLYDEYTQNINSYIHKEDFSTYPMAVRYADPYNGLYVIERPPFQIDMDFSTSKSYRGRRTPKFLSQQKIWIPWTISIISFKKYNSTSYQHSFHLLFNDKPISSLDEVLVPAYLPNVGYPGQVCLGEDSLKVNQTISQNPSDIASIYNMAFNSYFSGWNSDLSPQFTITNYLKDIIVNRISKNPKAPKSYKDLANNPNILYAFYGTNSKYLSKILYTISNMDLSETIQYITSVKEYYQNNSSINSLTLSKLVTGLSKQKSSPDILQLDDYSYNHMIKDLLFDLSRPIHSGCGVFITNYNQDYPIHLMINNPMIIAKIYETVIENYFNSSINNFNLTFDFKDIAHYSKEYQNA